MTDILFINSNEALAEYCRQLQRSSLIAVDTEFLRMRTYYPKPGLFQFNDGENIALVDPLAVTQWQPLAEVLVNPDVVKVMHACDEDVELFYHFLGIQVQPVFDTQVAAALCGFDYSMGYQRLVQDMLGVELEKTSSRSDWMQRPLTSIQVHYAANDVRYLPDIYQQLQAKLAQKQFAQALAEEYQAVLANVTNTDFTDAYQRVKQAWKLNAPQFARLKALATWRETLMREKDLPRKKVAADEALMLLASRSSWTQQKLFSVEGLPAATVKAEGEALLQLLSAVDTAQASETVPKPVKMGAIAQSLKARLAAAARSAGIAEPLLLRKLWINELIPRLQAGNYALPESIQGWRQPYYQQALTQMQARYQAEQKHD